VGDERAGAGVETYLNGRGASTSVTVCTLALAWQVFDDTPVAVVANRDEADGRPAEPPRLWDDEDGPRFVAPRDAEAGGTWVGYNEAGLFVGITNRWENVDRLSSERSRGLLVRDALERASAHAARAHVERELREREYQPFHLVLADAETAYLLAWNGELTVHELSPGVHVVVNVGFDGDYFVPTRRSGVGEQQARDTNRVIAATEPRKGETASDWTTRSRGVLADHAYGRCIHGDGFGTKSSTVVRVGNPHGAVEHAEGRPCETAFEPVETPF
jgi:uncharacterized protein with NRDE domain